MKNYYQIAYFISPHGYGHAARAAAVMEALHVITPATRFEIFTKVPRPFFEDSLENNFGYHSLLTDIGLVQKNSLVEDLPETVRRLDEFLPLDQAQIDSLAQLLKQLDCQLVLCDIAPMGIAVAKAAKIPAVLIENFTWDWIYEGYRSANGVMGKHIPYLQTLFAMADYHIQTQPVCTPQAVDLMVSPVSRKRRTPAVHIRQQLGVPHQARLVMVTMGGSGAWKFPPLDRLEKLERLYFIIASNGDVEERRSNVIILPRQSNFFHPDLVNASDALVGKIGYSTLAEVYHAGIPFAYLTRPKFRETAILTDFIKEHMQGLALTEAQFQDGSWLDMLPDLLALPRHTQDRPNGADQIVKFIKEMF